LGKRGKQNKTKQKGRMAGRTDIQSAHLPNTRRKKGKKEKIDRVMSDQP
jgi:hypothetical protein